MPCAQQQPGEAVMQKRKFDLRPLQVNDHAAAIDILARAMCDNPIHVRVFGSDRPRRLLRLQRFFPGLLDYLARKGELHGACADGQLAGIVGMLPPGHCRPSIRDILRMLPGILRSNSPLGSVRTLYWLARWARLDPAEPHWHLGPLAVDPDWQGQGAGHQLMQYACQRCTGALLYLETDTPENVALYQTIGFRTHAHVRLLGYDCWLMTRPPQ